MTAERDILSEHLTFSQRYGYEPLPEPMRLEHISEALRRDIWNSVRAHLLKRRTFAYGATFFKEKEKRFIERVLGRPEKTPESRVSTDYEEVMNKFEHIMMSGCFSRILDFLEVVFDEMEFPDIFAEQIKDLFKRHAAAYWLDLSQRPYRFSPSASQEQAEATQQAIETIRRGGMDGAATHLRQAAGHVNAGQYTDSIADGIHAVESVARMMDSNSSKTLGPALGSLERAGVLKHPALRRAFDTLYGYTNTEQGIRHALLDKDSADVGLSEAIFMLGACASFAAYLSEKHRQVGGA